MPAMGLGKKSLPHTDTHPRMHLRTSGRAGPWESITTLREGFLPHCHPMRGTGYPCHHHHHEMGYQYGCTAAGFRFQCARRGVSHTAMASTSTSFRTSGDSATVVEELMEFYTKDRFTLQGLVYFPPVQVSLSLSSHTHTLLPCACFPLPMSPSHSP